VDLNSGIELKLKFVPGRKVLYTLETQLEQQVQQSGQVLRENDQTFTAHIRQRVIGTDDDGSGHLVTSTTPPDQDPEGDQRQIVYQRLSPQGTVLDVSGMNPTNSFALPEEKVTEDSSWVGEIVLPLPQATEPVRCATEYIVTGMTEFNGLQCVNIDCQVEEFEFDMPLPNNQGTAKVLMGSHGSMLFAPKEGILARMEVETVTSPHVGQLVFTTSTMITQEFKSFEN
jgi:hypothetical protein